MLVLELPYSLLILYNSGQHFFQVILSLYLLIPKQLFVLLSIDLSLLMLSLHSGYLSLRLGELVEFVS